MMLINRLGTLILPFLVLYTTVELGWSAVDGGWAAASFGCGSLAGAYLGGVLTDRMGYHRTMLFVTTKQTQTRAISLLRMAFNLGIAIGPAVAGAFVVHIGYRSIFVIDALTCLLAGIFMLAYIKNHEVDSKADTDHTATTSIRSPYHDVPFLLFLLSNILILIPFFQIVCTVPLYIKEYMQYTEQAVGLFFTVNGLIIFVFEMLIVSYIERRLISKYRSLVTGGFMMAVALLCLSVESMYLLPFIGYTLLASFGEIINFPFISTTAMDRSSAASRRAIISAGGSSCLSTIIVCSLSANIPFAASVTD